jgi:hypothetical protein
MEGINSTESRIWLLAGTFVALSFPFRGLVMQEVDEEPSISHALFGIIPCSPHVPEDFIVFEDDVVHVTNCLHQDTFCQGWFALSIGSVIATGGYVQDGKCLHGSQPFL